MLSPPCKQSLHQSFVLPAVLWSACRNFTQPYPPCDRVCPKALPSPPWNRVHTDTLPYTALLAMAGVTLLLFFFFSNSIKKGTVCIAGPPDSTAWHYGGNTMYPLLVRYWSEGKVQHYLIRFTMRLTIAGPFRTKCMVWNSLVVLVQALLTIDSQSRLSKRLPVLCNFYERETFTHNQCWFRYSDSFSRSNSNNFANRVSWCLRGTRRSGLM